MNSTPARFASLALIALLASAGPAAALEQTCRFIQARADREACYTHQEEQLAARRKPAPKATEQSATMDSLRQMRQDDDAVDRSIHGICRGC
jgi:hypothetical protein